MKIFTRNHIKQYIIKMFPLFLLFISPQGLSADCTSCQPNEACYGEVGYVDYTPWEAGDDAGLWCLPGSTCTYSCPTRPTGAEIYMNVSRTSHNARYPSERTPEQWRTVMMHMRALLPMTACDYRMTLAFMQGREVKVEKPAELTTENKDANSTSKENSLEEAIGPVSASSQELMGASSSGFTGYQSKFNHVFTGYVEANYHHPFISYFGDFNGNNSFSYVFAPVFLSSYGESLILVSKIAVYNFGQEAQFDLPFAYLSYFFNDYITFTAGKFVIPLGSYYNFYLPPWIDKSATRPLCGDFFEYFMIHPIVDIGFKVSGAIPLCFAYDWFEHPSFTYDLWIGNGPSEVSDFTPFTALYPNGSIYFGTDAANAPNNNNEFAWGGRLAFLPDSLDFFGLSYMRGRWSSNKVAFSYDLQGTKRVFQAACFDWNVNFCPSIVFRGEFKWTQYEGNLPEFPWVRQTAYWAALSSGFDILSWICPDLYCWKPCLWDSLELVLRSEAIWSQPSGKASLGKFNGGFDYSGFDRKRFCVTLGYYFTQSLTAKIEYAYNYGDTDLNGLREFLTGSSKKTGFGNDVVTFRVAYGF